MSISNASHSGEKHAARGLRLRPSSRRLIQRLPRLIRLTVVPCFILIAWQISAEYRLVNAVYLPPPTKILIAAQRLISSGELARHFADSLFRIAMANIVAISVAVPLGFFMGLYRPFEDLMDGVLNVLRPIPPLAWIPLAILWFGIGEKSVVFITLLAAFFAMLLNTIIGVRSVEVSLVRAALTLGASRRILILRVILPATLPFLFVGFRIALGVSWMSIVAAELIAASSGLGFLITYYRDLLRPDIVVVGMLSIGIVGFLMDRGLLWLERKLLPWRVSLHLR